MIISRNNALIKTVRALDRKKERDETGLYIAEGLKTVKEAVATGQEFFALILTESGEKLLAGTELPRGVRAELVSEEVFASCTGEVSPQGVLAVLYKPKKPICASSGKSLFLDGVSDPANVGAIIRTAAATSFTDIFIADGADAYSPKAVRAAMSGIFRVNVFAGRREELVNLIGSPFYAADMGGKNPFKTNVPERFCLVIGNEAHGVSEFMKERTSETLGLPMKNGMESLNASVAAGVLMYALTNG